MSHQFLFPLNRYYIIAKALETIDAARPSVQNRVRSLSALKINIFSSLVITLAVVLLPTVLAVEKSALDLNDILDSTVVIKGHSNSETTSYGAGFLVQGGYLITSNHVIEGAYSITFEARWSDTPFETEVVWSNTEKDIAILRNTSGRDDLYLSFAEQQPEIGTDVYTVGHPQGLSWTLSSGTISGVRTLTELTMLQLTAPTSQGSSGGPVVNQDGLVLGIVAGQFLGGQNLNVAVSYAEIEYALVKLATSAQPKSPTSVNGPTEMLGAFGYYFGETLPVTEDSDYAGIIRDMCENREAECGPPKAPIFSPFSSNSIVPREPSQYFSDYRAHTVAPNNKIFAIEGSEFLETERNVCLRRFDIIQATIIEKYGYSGEGVSRIISNDYVIGRVLGEIFFWVESEDYNTVPLVNNDRHIIFLASQLDYDRMHNTTTCVSRILYLDVPLLIAERTAAKAIWDSEKEKKEREFRLRLDRYMQDSAGGL